MLDLQLLDLVDPNKEKFVGQEPQIQSNLNAGLSNTMKKTDETTNAFEQAKDYYAKTQSNPIMAFIEQNFKPERNEEKEARLKQIAGINALGQGLTTIIDAIYAKKGAKVPIRKDNTTDKIMQALADEEQKYALKEGQYKNMKLSQLIRDVDLERADKLRGEGKAQKEADYQRKIKREDELTDESRAYQDKVRKEGYDQQKKLAGFKANQKESAKGFDVVYGYDSNRKPLETKLSDGVFRDVFKRVGELKGFSGDEIDSLLEAYNNPNADRKTKQQVETIVLNNWDKFYTVKNGEVILKEKSGELYDKDTTNFYKDQAAKTITYKVGNKIYNIPSSEAEDFLKDFPNAVKQ